MSETARIKVRRAKKGTLVGTVEFGPGKCMPLPPFYELRDESLNGAECEVEREKGQIVRVSVGGIELPRKDHAPSPSGLKRSAALGREATSPALTRRTFPDATRPTVFLPRDTRQILPQGPDNFGLCLQKWATYDYKERAFRPPLTKCRFGPPYGPQDLFSLLDQRRQSSLQAAGLEVERLVGKSRGKIVVGLGSESVYETSLTLHPLYGFPYIPATAIKGAVRSAVIQEHFGGDEAKALNDPSFCWVFGGRVGKEGSSQQGGLLFFDGYPLTPPTVASDIINPHYVPYYQDPNGNFPPGEYYEPTPVFFLIVEDTEWVFYLGVSGKGLERLNEKREGKYLLDRAASWVKAALSSYGLGAKTSLGYGLIRWQ